MKKLILSILLPLFVSSLASADIICIKRENNVSRGKVPVRNMLVLRSSGRCPGGYVLFVNTDTFLKDGSVTTAKIADGAVTEAKLAAGIVLRSISINPFGAQLGGGATVTGGFGQNAGINLPDTGSPSFSLGFTLPQDYVSGTAVKVNLLALINATTCTVDFEPNSIAVTRSGAVPLIGAGASTGLTVTGGNTLIFPATANSAVKVELNIVAPDGTQLQPGDSVIFSMFRSSDLGTDTCAAALKVQGVEVRY